MPNRLAASTSPYLRQHADNPVDWREWGEEAFAEARERDVPIFLSVGYSSCHWCHVMAHESFEDEATAEELNARFVNVKVDREERPDVDAIYMKAVQGMTGRGGWPMSVFLTPDARPFFAGTYFPARETHGMPSFGRVLRSVSEAWAERRGDVLMSADRITESIAASTALDVADRLDPVGTVDAAAALVLDQAWDRTFGGFGRAPKFPHAMTLTWLLARHARTADEDPLAASVQALDQMARGGINDVLAGGFARYSTDAQWLVPHFEKMLYDNALLLVAYAHAAALDGDAALERVMDETVGFLLSDFITADGTFVAAFDADTDGEEGRTYVWSSEEFQQVVSGIGQDAERFARFCGVTETGNWEQTNILHEPVPRDHFAREEGLDVGTFAADWATVRAALAERRAERPQPGVDDKVLTDWNALAVRGLVVAGRLHARRDWIEAGIRAAEVLHRAHAWNEAQEPEAAGSDAAPDADAAGGMRTRLFHTGRIAGFLEDYANLALADLELFAATGSAIWFERARGLASAADAYFSDPAGGWFQTSSDGPRLIARPKETWDNATPAGTSVMIEVCRRLHALTGEAQWAEQAERALLLLQDAARRMPTGFGHVLRQFEELAAGPVEVVIIGEPGPERDLLERTALATHVPTACIVVASDDHGDRVPILAHRRSLSGRPAAYVCHAMVCERPVVSAADLAVALARPGRGVADRAP